MKNMLKIKKAGLLLLILIGVAAKSAYSVTLYMAVNGKDSNSGTKEAPLATLAGARDKIRALRNAGNTESVQVIIADGKYFMKEPVTFTPQDAGTSTTSVTYIAEKNAKPVFYAGAEIKGLEAVNSHLWRVLIPEVQRYGWNFEQLYVNDHRAVRAMFPNHGFFHPKSVTETVVIKGKESTPELAIQKITLLPEQAALFNSLPEADLENAVVTFYHKWDNTRKRIVHYSAKDTAFYVTGQGMKFWNKLDAKTLFTVENLKAGLDAPGEWYLEPSGYLYYGPKEGETIANTTCYAPVSDKFMIISGTKDKKVENLHFENLGFSVAGYKMPAMGNDPMQGAAFVEATIMADYATKIEFLNCEISHTGSNAIWFRKDCSYSSVKHCYLHDLGAGAVKIGEVKLPAGNENTSHIIVDNNIVRNGGYVFPCAVGLLIFTGSDCELTHNEIADFKYSGISAGWVWGYGNSTAKRNKIDFNHIHHLGWGVLSEMGGVYTLAPSEGTTVSNNVIHHVYSATYGGWGLYTDEGSTGIVMENNVVYACKSSAFHQHYGKDNIIRNNIFYNQILAQLEASKAEIHTGFQFTNNIICYSQGNLTGIRWDKCNFITDYNAYWDTRTKDIMVATQTFKQWQEAGKDVHSIIADPKFVDAAHLNFKIGNKSLLNKIKFKPFDYSHAGVYGDEAWKELAKFDVNLAKQFDAIVEQAEGKQIDYNAGL